jgi:hypothetical protein
MAESKDKSSAGVDEEESADGVGDKVEASCTDPEVLDIMLSD